MTRTRTLSDRMDFDHVVQVHEDGTVTDMPYPGRREFWAPTLMDGEIDSDDWTLLHGFTGQYGYNGPIMHNSEYIGGALERHILETPGVYVALVGYWSSRCIHCEAYVREDEHGSWVDDSDGDGCDSPSGVHESTDDNAEGWAVAYREYREAV